MANDSVVKYKSGTEEVTLSPGIVRQYLVSGGGAVSDQEVMMFLQLCKSQHLNPFLREAYLIKYGNSPAAIVTGRGTFDKRANEHPEFDGLESGLYLESGGEVSTRMGSFRLPAEKIAGAWAKVHRKDREHPTEAHVAFDEYVGRTKDGQVNRQWSSKPATMILKVAEVQALRKAFPDQFNGLYDSAEMNVNGDDQPTERVVVAEEKDNREEFAQRLAELHAELDALNTDNVLNAEELGISKDYLGNATRLETLEKAWVILQGRIDEKRTERQEEVTPEAEDAEVIAEAEEEQELF